MEPVVKMVVEKIEPSTFAYTSLCLYVRRTYQLGADTGEVAELIFV